MVDWLHDRLYLVTSEREEPVSSTTSRSGTTTAAAGRARAGLPLPGSRVWSGGQPFYLEHCNLEGADCRHLDVVFKRKPEYIQV
jgi:hypothetical protein